MFKRWGAALSCAVLAGLVLSGAAQARVWHPKRASMAQVLDYLQIIDMRSAKEGVFVLWLAPQLAEGSADIQPLLDKYVVIAVARSRLGDDGVLNYENITALAVRDGDGNSLKPVVGDAIPLKISGFIANATAYFSKNLGTVGQGFHYFVFESGDVTACGKGKKLIIPYDGENYSYDTPIPGCAAP